MIRRSSAVTWFKMVSLPVCLGKYVGRHRYVRLVWSRVSFEMVTWLFWYSHMRPDWNLLDDIADIYYRQEKICHGALALSSWKQRRSRSFTSKPSARYELMEMD